MDQICGPETRATASPGARLFCSSGHAHLPACTGQPTSTSWVEGASDQRPTRGRRPHFQRPRLPNHQLHHPEDSWAQRELPGISRWPIAHKHKSLWSFPHTMKRHGGESGRDKKGSLALGLRGLVRAPLASPAPVITATKGLRSAPGPAPVTGRSRVHVSGAPSEMLKPMF